MCIQMNGGGGGDSGSAEIGACVTFRVNVIQTHRRIGGDPMSVLGWFSIFPCLSPHPKLHLFIER
jgi:hypothetical protein